MRTWSITILNGSYMISLLDKLYVLLPTSYKSIISNQTKKGGFLTQWLYPPTTPLWNNKSKIILCIIDQIHPSFSFFLSLFHPWLSSLFLSPPNVPFCHFNNFIIFYIILMYLPFLMTYRRSGDFSGSETDIVNDFVSRLIR